MASLLDTPSLTTFLKKNYQNTTQIPSSLIRLLDELGKLGIKIQEAIASVNFSGMASGTQCYNASGDEQQQLDLIAHNYIVGSLSELGSVCALLSEEAEDAIWLSSNGNYIVALDPIDGSNNITINGPIGTIFSVYKRISHHNDSFLASDLLQSGRQQVASGYLLYGTATLLVCSLGAGVHSFTYHQSLKQFFLLNPAITIPKHGIFYAVNDGAFDTFPPYVQNYLCSCRKEGLSARYFGALVADFHQILIKGGIYMYPATQKNPKGKLRLLFECNALAFIAQQAQGLAISDRGQDILTIQPTSIHQQAAFYIGSKYMVQTLMSGIR